MKLRQYQTIAVKNTISNLLSGKDVVLAGCPGSGKTEMSIYIIKKMLDSGKKVLVLAHSTNVLKNNFQNRWNNYYKDHTNLTICIPQSYVKDSYDFVVIDEAHENYLAKTVQDIVSDIPMRLLLTGTPSKLIYKGGFHIEAIAMEDVPREFFAKTGIELLSTCYKWTQTDYNNQGNLKSAIDISKEDTESTLDLVIDKLIDRIRNKSIDPERFNKPGILTRVRKHLFKSQLGKTMFVCSRTSQADFVNDYLINKGYDSKVSHSESDEDSKLFDAFQNGEFDVLVVVNRGRLGYSDDNLMNIVDMSGTKNPDLIYQLFARCVRGNQSQNKLFLKLAPTGEAMHDLIAVSTQMALSLMFKDVLTKFNGRNMKGMFIPIFKSDKKTSSSTSTKKDKPKSNRVIFPQYTCDVIVELKNIRYSLDDEMSVYKMGEIGQIISDITGRWTIDKAIELAKKMKGRDEFKREYPGAYSVLWKNKLLKDVFNITTLNDSIEIGKKFKYKKDFEIAESSHYARVKRAGLLDELFKEKKPKKIIDREEVFRLKKQGLSGVDISKKMNCSKALISNILNYKK